MNQEATIGPLPEKSPAVRIFGIGSAGVGVLAHLAGDKMPEGSLVAIHSNTAALATLARVEKIEVQNRTARRLSAANETGNEGSAADDALARVRSLCAGVETVFIIAGMGGVLGDGLSPSVARVAREAGAFVLAFAVMPFECEGSWRMELAGAGLKKLQEAVDLVLCCPNQQSLGLINEQTSLADTFNLANRLLAGGVRASWRAFSSETAMGQAFPDLCQSMIQCSKECYLAIAEAAGPNRVPESVDRLFAHPLAGTNIVPAPKTVAVFILGGASLGMTEVTRIMEHFQARCETSSLLMGAANIPELGDNLLLAVMFSTVAVETESSRFNSRSEPDALLPGKDRGNLGFQLLENTGQKRSSRFLPPPPALPPEKMQQLLKQQGRAVGRARKGQPSFRQTQLPLEILSKGRFDKSEPTIHKGEDLDVPTYIRRGMALN
jgi:cell division protein FtsZ